MLMYDFCSIRAQDSINGLQIVCARGRFHSKLIHEGTDSAMSVTSGGVITLEEHQKAYRNVANTMKTSMYFM